MSDHQEPHMPPNSFVPISLAGSLSLTFVSFLFGFNWLFSATAWKIIGVSAGLIWMAITLVVWAMAARSEYLELPEDMASH